MEKLALGTVEHLLVDVVDRLQNLTSLDDTNATFDVVRESDEAVMVTAQPATNIGLTAYCLLDTTTPVDAWTPGEHRLYLNFEALPETPRLGPFKFLLVA